jgi:hypothetical protein
VFLVDLHYLKRLRDHFFSTSRAYYVLKNACSHSPFEARMWKSDIEYKLNTSSVCTHSISNDTWVRQMCQADLQQPICAATYLFTFDPHSYGNVPFDIWPSTAVLW